MAQNDTKKTLEKVIGWLEEENGGKRLVNQKWEVTPLEGTDVIMATTDGLPFSIGIEVTDRFVNLVIYTGIETAVLPNQERLKLYRDILLLNNENQMMKFLLAGREETIGIRVDLDIMTLGKMEFNDALSSLVVGVLVGVFALGLEDEFVQKVMERIVLMLVERIQEGQSEEDLMRFLTEKVGMDVRDARNLLDEVLMAMERIE